MRPGFFGYLRMQLRRVGKLLLPSVLMSALLLLGIAGAGSTLLREDENATQRVRIGVVGDFDDSILRMGMFALRNLDSSRFSVEFLEFSDEQEAQTRLRTGGISAYVRIPPDFVTGVYEGEFEPLTYVTVPGAQGVGTALTEELVASVSELLSVSEDAVYGAERYAAAQGITLPEGSAGDLLAVRFMERILRREDLLQVEILGVGDGLSLPQYFLCGFLVMYLLLWGVSASPVFAGQDRSLNRLLGSRGLGPLRQVLAEYLAYLTLMAVSMTISAALLSAALRLFGADALPEGFLEPAFLRHTVPVMLGIAALQVLCYECATGMLQGVLLQFLLAVVLGYLCGCLYPVGFFPEFMQHLGNLLPAGVARRYLSTALTGADSLAMLLGLAAYGLGALGLSAGVRWLRQAR